VLNDTRVIPARLFGKKESGGKVELLLDRPLSESRVVDGWNRQTWSCLVRASKKLKIESRMLLPQGAWAIYLGKDKGPGGQVQLNWPGDLDAYLKQHGQMPLPHYIHRLLEDPRADVDMERYQTVFARRSGAIAAPTAGLHFTSDLLKEIERKGVKVCTITLHVGPGTFLPVRSENLDDHVMHAERFQVSENTAQELHQARAEGRRVVAVGTTVVRCLESAFEKGRLKTGQDETRLFIRPGYRFQVVDALLTNFHLPRSTLLMLVCAFSEKDHILNAYRHAIESGYRFYSYGDAMWIA
jgi:S-adenosylmethionine:tRNA ribosyltransferase-isomerase